MIQRNESSNTTRLVSALLLFSLVFVNACGGDEVVENSIQTVPAEAPLPVREWYPSVKVRQYASPYAPVPVMQQAPLGMPPPGYPVTRQAVPRPVYNSAWPVYPQFPPQPQTNPASGWTAIQPAVIAPAPTYWQLPRTAQQPAQPNYQYVPRPWGEPVPADPNRTVISTDSWPQGGYVLPWGTAPPGSDANAVTGGAEQQPWSVYQGYAW